MLVGIGTVLMFMGLASILWGDKELRTKGGTIPRFFSWPRGRAKWAKWGIGIALIYAGIMIMFHMVNR